MQAFSLLDESLSSWAQSLSGEIQDCLTGIRSQLPCVM
jgi:hypothetical protein